MPAEEHPATDQSKLMKKRDVLWLIPVSHVTLWTWIRNGYFPAPRIVGGKSMWIASDVYGWIEKRPSRRYKAVKGA